MTGQMGDNLALDRPPVSRFDWALVSLLQRVQTKIINPLVEEWWRLAEGSDSRKQNAALLRNIWTALRPLKVNTSHYSDDCLTHPDLVKIIKDNAHRLFNSYYYVRVDTQGREYFFPVKPGFTTFPLGGAEELDKFHDYVRGLELPFSPGPSSHVFGYTGTLLPGQAGITPQVCLQAQRDRSFIEPEVVPVFLGDLAILGKAEDAVQRHLSAMIAPFVKSGGDAGIGDCLGAFVLTSSVPNAFQSHWLRNELNTLMQSWLAGPIELLHDVARVEWRDAKAEVGPPGELDAAAEAALKRRAEIWLGKLSKSGAAAVSFDARHDRWMRAVNHDSLVMALRSRLCPSPLLALETYSTKERVEPRRLREILDALAALRDREGLLAADELASVFDTPVDLADLIQDGDRSPLQGVAVTSADTFSLALYRGELNPARLEEIKESLSQLLADIDRITKRPLLPGERPKTYSILEQFEHWKNHDKNGRTIHRFGDDDDVLKILDIHHKIRVLLDTEVASILVFEKCNIFAPIADEKAPFGVSGIHDFSEEGQKSIESAILNPASFWLYEQVCHGLMADDFPVKRMEEPVFCNDGEYEIPKPLPGELDVLHPLALATPRPGPIRKKLASALNYLGIPVCDWHLASAKLKVEDNLNRLGPAIAKIRKAYIESLLKDGAKNPAILRATRGLDASSQEVDIKSIVPLGPFPNDTLGLRFEIALDGKPTAEADVTFVRVPTMRLEFAGIALDKIVKMPELPAGERAQTVFETTAKAWFPSGWQVLGRDNHEEYTEAVEQAYKFVRSIRELPLFERSREFMHESKSLLHAVDALQRALGEPGSGAGGPRGDSNGAEPTLAELPAVVHSAFRHLTLERMLLELEVYPDQPADTLSARLRSPAGTAAGDLSELSSFAIAQGVCAADALLSLLSRGERWLNPQAWQLWFGEMVKDKLILDDIPGPLWNLEGDGIERGNHRILVLAKTMASLIKHSTLYIVGRAGRPDDITPDHVDRGVLSDFESVFELEIGKERIRTQNRFAEGTAQPKIAGTEQILSRLLRSEVWGNARGSVSDWKPNTQPGGDVFQVTIDLPPTFWS
jgi:hypothetical protein